MAWFSVVWTKINITPPVEVLLNTQPQSVNYLKRKCDYVKDNFNKLVEINTKVDPDNFFRNEQSIPMLSYQKL